MLRTKEIFRYTTGWCQWNFIYFKLPSNSWNSNWTVGNVSRDPAVTVPCIGMHAVWKDHVPHGASYIHPCLLSDCQPSAPSIQFSIWQVFRLFCQSFQVDCSEQSPKIMTFVAKIMTFVTVVSFIHLVEFPIIWFLSYICNKSYSKHCL